MKIVLSAVLVAASLCAHAQDFPGFRAGNYAGVNSVFYNPANIADSRYRWDYNLFSVSTGLGNNQASFKLKDVFSGSFNEDSIKNKIFGNQAGAESGNFNLTFVGPAILFNLNAKSSIALSSRTRMMMNIDNLDGKLANQLLNDGVDDKSFPYTIASSQNMRMTVNAWSEFGGTYARVITNKGPNFLKAGLTVKYLAGVLNTYINIDHLNSTLNLEQPTGNVYMNNTTGNIGMGFGGIHLSDFEASDLTKFKSSGFGADLGVVYEFRPHYTKYMDEETGNEFRNMNKYKLRLGLALLDIGSIKYERDVQRSGDYALNITGTKKFYLNQLDTAEIDNYKQFFDSRPQFFTPQAGNNAGSYRVPLPSTLQLDVDYHFNKGLYVNLAGQFSLASNKAYAAHYYRSLTITPRYEGKGFGFYVPINYSDLTKFNAGASLRAGPLFFGSGSILSAFFNDSRQADFFFGLHFGGLQKKYKHKKNKPLTPANEPAQ